MTIEILATARVAGLRELADEEIARRVVGGESELFELLMRRYNQRLFRVARGIVATDAEAEDVLQDAWVRAYQHLAGFRGEARLATWLARIAAHEALARVRRGRRFVALPREAEEIFAGAESASPENVAAKGELRSALESAVARLAPRYRSVFLLRAVEGLSTAETAATLEVSEEVVKVRLHRARARLRTDLAARLGVAAPALFGFAGESCDRVVATVLARVDALAPAG